MRGTVSKRLFLLLCIAIVIGVIFTLGLSGIFAGSESANTKQNILYDFEKDTMGFIYGWGTNKPDGTTRYTTELATNSNKGALGVDVEFLDSSSFDEKNIKGVASGDKPFDLTGYEKIDYDVFVPSPDTFPGTLKIRTALNGPNWQDLNPAENYDLKNAEKVTISGKVYGKIHKSDSVKDLTNNEYKELIITLAGGNSNYKGSIFIDNFTIIAGNSTTVVTGSNVSATNVTSPAVTATDVTVVAPSKKILYDFEKDTMGWEKAWGDNFSQVPVEHKNLGSTIGGTLAVNVDYKGGSWEEANFGVWLSGKPNTTCNLSLFEKVTYDLYIPSPRTVTGTLKLGFALDKTWAEFGTFKDYEISKIATSGNGSEYVTIDGKEYVKIHREESMGAANKTNSGKLIIRIAAYKCIYKGPLYFDNVQFVKSSKLLAFVSSPTNYQEVSGKSNVECMVAVPDDQVIKNVTLKSPSGKAVSLSLDETKGVYTGIWDSTLEKDGFQTFSVLAVSNKEQTSTTQEVFIKNSTVNIEILSPTFDAQIDNVCKIEAKVTSKGAEISSVKYQLGWVNMPMLKGENGIYSGLLMPLSVEDGAHTLVVTATSGKHTIQTPVDVVIRKNGFSTSFASSVGKDLVLDNKKFRYVGTNAYDLPFKDTRKIATNEKAVVFAPNGKPVPILVKAGTTLSYEQQTDRTMIEAQKLGITVLRTWGFNSSAGEATSFYKSDWTFNEDQFKRFDYLMESARKHNIRVIITFSNYWTTYGGIEAYTKKLGFDNKLKFFTEPKVKDLFKAYMAHFINRENTINKMKYHDDPTVFAWDLMNEPRMDQNDDPQGKDGTLWDPTGEKLGAWIAEMSTYIKTLDKNHMVTVGSECHGIPFDKFPDGTDRLFVWDGGGNGRDPIKVMNQKDIDFLSFHPYPNEEWMRYEYDDKNTGEKIKISRYTLEDTKKLITKIVTDSQKANKPMIMQEWGIKKTEALRDPGNGNKEVHPSEPGYQKLRMKWFDEMLNTFRNVGGDGSMIWMLQTNLQEPNFGVTMYSPGNAAIEDSAFTQRLAKESRMIRYAIKPVITPKPVQTPGVTTKAPSPTPGLTDKAPDSTTAPTTTVVPQPTPGKNGKIPNTGEENPTNFVLIGLFISIVGVAIIVYRKKTT